MGQIKSHRDLIAWQLAKQLAVSMYRVTKRMPRDERFGLTMQMRRAAISVPSNIAEGYARQTLPDYLRHLRIARGSLAELSTQYELAIEMDLMADDPSVASLLTEVQVVLQSLIMSLERKL